MTGRREAANAPSSAQSQPRQNVYFVPRDGIDREVITADICRYLGRDALVRPGTYQDPSSGQLMQGYHITAYRNLTSAMIQDLKNDSARWEQERRKHSSGGPNRYGGYGGAQGPSTYPGSDAPGYSGSGGSAYQQDYQGQQPTGYQNAQYSSGQQYPPPQPGTSGYNTQQTGGAGAYAGQAQYTNAYGQPDTNTPYVNVGANHAAFQDPRAPVDASSSRVYSSGYPSQGQADPRSAYYSQSQVQGGYTQPVDPFLGRGNAYPTSQADYSTSTQPVAYQYVSDTPQYESSNQTPPPSRAVTSPSTSTNAQTGNSGTSHSRHHRDRDQRDGRDSRAERHSRRP